MITEENCVRVRSSFANSQLAPNRLLDNLHSVSENKVLKELSCFFSESYPAI